LYVISPASDDRARATFGAAGLVSIKSGVMKPSVNQL
jgi:hypothetical protein